MRVLHLFNIFGALTERAMLDYTLGLARSGCEITVGCEQIAEDAPHVPFELVKLARVNVEPAEDVGAQMQQLARTVDDPARRRLLEMPFDLVHAHFGPRILWGAAWLARGAPMIVSCYGYDVGRLLRDRCWAQRYRWAAERGARFVALADFMRQRLVGLGVPERSVSLIRLGIDLSAHHYDPRPAPPRPRFVFIGRFVEKKGADVLLRALGHLRNEMQVSAELDLIGAGPMEGALRDLAGELRLGDSVRFVGIVPFAKLFDWMRGATALVQPSVTAADGDAEGAPMVLMHAQAAGVPCITTAHSGNPEVLPPDAQEFVVPERDARSLALAMEAMTRLSPERRLDLQGKARHWVEAQYDLQTTIDLYGELYRSEDRRCARAGSAAGDVTGADEQAHR